ncbi:MAG: DNA-protecting protein DprA, partial [Treponema sp.]|nr:DNA-protecting protein DprA [Treponema sp.]
LGRELGEAGINVVSGLALGIDAMAHRGNIEGRAHTVAVLGSSPDLVYSASNRELARRILETGGLLLSEYPPGTRPLKWHFPERNRIISALARGTVIVEAPEKSGALITARFAIEQDRDLWVDRVGVSSKLGGGTARLAEEGAGLISSAADILAEWNMAGEADGVLVEKKVKKENSKEPVQGNGAFLASSLADDLGIKL